MVDRTLTWFAETSQVGQQLQVYRLDRDYTPLRLTLRSAEVSNGGDLIVDVHYTHEGVEASIFTSPHPNIGVGMVEGEREHFDPFIILKKDGLVSFLIDQVGPGGGSRQLSVSLELEYK